MSVPTRGETFAQILEHIIKTREGCAMMAHLHNADGNDADKLLAKGWFGIEELLQRMQAQITKLAMGRLQ